MTTFYEAYEKIYDAIIEDVKQQFEDNDIDIDVDLPNEVKVLIRRLDDAVGEYMESVADSQPVDHIGNIADMKWDEFKERYSKGVWER